jgi:hypothetical protein
MGFGSHVGRVGVDPKTQIASERTRYPLAINKNSGGSRGGVLMCGLRWWEAGMLRSGGGGWF